MKGRKGVVGLLNCFIAGLFYCFIGGFLTSQNVEYSFFYKMACFAKHLNAESRYDDRLLLALPLGIGRLISTTLYPALLIRRATCFSASLILHWLAKSVCKRKRYGSAVPGIFYPHINILVVHGTLESLRLKYITNAQFQTSFLFQDLLLHTCVQPPHGVHNHLSFYSL